MDRAAKKSRDTAKALDAMVIAAGAAAVAFVGASVAMAMQSAKSMDEMRKLAQATGLSVESLSTLTYVASQNALEQQTLVNALGRLTKGMSDAVAGTGDAKKAFDALGISVQDANGRLRASDEVLIDLAEEISKLEDGTQKTALAIQVFGRSGAQLVPLLNNGRQGIKDLADEARRFGVVLNTDVAKNAERFNDNLTRLATVQQGLAWELTGALLPAMESVTDFLVKFSSETVDLSSKIETALKVAGNTAVAVAAIFAGRLAGSITASAASWVTATAGAASYQAQLARLSAVVTGTSAAMATMSGVATGAMVALTRAATLLSGVLGGPVGLLVTAGILATTWLTMGSNARLAASGIDAMTSSLDELTAAQLRSVRHKLAAELDELREEARKAGAQVSWLESLVSDYGATSTNVTQAIDHQAAAHDSAAQSAEKVKDRLAEVDAALSDIASGFRSATGAAQGLNDELNGTNEAGKKYLERLRDMALMAGATTEVEKLNRLIKAGSHTFEDGGEEARKLAAHIDQMSASMRVGSQAAKDYATSLKSLLDAHLPENKALEDLHKNLSLLNDARKAGKVSLEDYDRALQSINLAYANSLESTKQQIEMERVLHDLRLQQSVTQMQFMRDLESFGQGDRVRELNADLAKIEDRYRSIIEQRRNSPLGLSDSELAQIQASLETELQMVRDYHEKKLAIQGDWALGAKDALINYADEAANIYESLGQTVSSAFKGMEDALVEFTRTGKLDFKSLADSIISDMVRIAIQQNVTGPLAGAFSSAIGGMFGGGLNIGAGAVSAGAGVSMASLSSGSGASWGAMLSLDSGGYTGDAPVDRFAGFVHGQEGVLNAQEIRALGGEAGFNALRRAIRGGGNAIGGMGGRPSLPSLPAMNQQNQQPQVVIHSTLNAAPGTDVAALEVAMEQNNAELEYRIIEGLKRGRYGV